MRRFAVIAAAMTAALVVVAPATASSRASVAALQVALRAHGVYQGPIDGIAGPLTRRGLGAFQQRRGLRPDRRVSPTTRRALGVLGQPLLGQRELFPGRVGWDVAALEFRLVAHGLPRIAVDGRFTAATAAALRRFQRARGLVVDGIAGPRTYRALAGQSHIRRARVVTRPLVHVVRPGEGFYVIAARYRVAAAGLARANRLTLASVLVPGQRLRVPGRRVLAASTPRVSPITHSVRPGESFFSIAQDYHVSPWQLARANGLSLTHVIVPELRLRLPAGARMGPSPAPADRDSVRGYLDRWAAAYGVDPALARALAWMESGFQQDVVSSVGAVGVMQLLPETWQWVDTMLLGQVTPRTAEGNVRAGVRYLRWQLDEFGGDVRLALAGWYQGARAVREIGLYDDTTQFVSVVLALHGKV